MRGARGWPPRLVRDRLGRRLADPVVLLDFVNKTTCEPGISNPVQAGGPAPCFLETVVASSSEESRASAQVAT